MARVLIGCERFGKVRDAYRALGHDAYSCDLVSDVNDSPYHIKQDVRIVARLAGWDMGIFHPDCTYLTCSAEWAYKDGPYHQKVKPGTLVGAPRRAARKEAVRFIEDLRSTYIPYKVFENPRGHLSSAWRKPDQTVQPYEFGDDASKATCLWLEGGLPKLKGTNYVAPRFVVHNGKSVKRWANQTDSGQNNLPPTPERAMLRAATYPGVATAMAVQWGAFLNKVAANDNTPQTPLQAVQEGLFAANDNQLGSKKAA